MRHPNSLNEDTSMIQQVPNIIIELTDPHNIVPVPTATAASDVKLNESGGEWFPWKRVGTYCLVIVDLYANLEVKIATAAEVMNNAIWRFLRLIYSSEADANLKSYCLRNLATGFTLASATWGSSPLDMIKKQKMEIRCVSIFWSLLAIFHSAKCGRYGSTFDGSIIFELIK